MAIRRGGGGPLSGFGGGLGGAIVQHTVVPTSTPEAPTAATHVDPATDPVVAAEGHFDLGGTNRFGGWGPQAEGYRTRVAAASANWAAKAAAGKGNTKIETQMANKYTPRKVGGRTWGARNTPGEISRP